MSTFLATQPAPGRSPASFAEQFPNPFVDVASMNMPQSMRTALQYSEFIWNQQATYRQAMERVLSYFMTNLELGGDDTDDDESNRWEEQLVETMGAISELQNALRDKSCYGNSFTSLIVPFKRFLVCPRCGLSLALKVVYSEPSFNFTWADGKFVATCPRCKSGSGYRGPWTVDDKPDDEERKIRIKRWNVHEIEILHDYYTDETAYLWRIPEDYKQQVRRGNLYHLERCSQPLLEAIRRNQMFRFNPDVIYHMKEPTLCGIRNRGWGMPRSLVNFRQIYYVQVLRRYNEAIALDYVVPFRLITPAPRPGGSAGGGAGQLQDPLMSFNMGDFRSQILSMIRRRRRDPAGWNVLPFPVTYQMLGGDAAKLAPRDLIDQGTEELLNGSGTPVELYKGSLQLQAAPVALRLFESTWRHLPNDANGWLRWLVQQIARVTNWKIIPVKLQRVTIADDFQKQLAQLQLFTGQQLSGETAFRSLGLDYRREQKRMASESLYQMKTQAQLQEEADQAGFAAQLSKGNLVPGSGGGAAMTPAGGTAVGGGQAAGGGQGGAAGGMGMAPSPVDQFIASAGGNAKVSPEELTQAADYLAQALLGQDEGSKNSQLRRLKTFMPHVHALTIEKLNAIRRQARQQGGAMVMQQQYGVAR